ncbi:MAG: cyclase family protein [Candidatus Tectomicrobia bacterium]|nr:cyclase family protein [Candidatus Tectomicrobia bacterium]
MAKQRKGPRVYDLSLPIENYANEPFPPEIMYTTHVEGTRRLGKAYGLATQDFPEGMALASENITLTPHTGTHADAQWHFGPTCAGRRSRTIDEMPLEWFYGDGAVLDLHHKKAAESITAEDVREAEKKVKAKIGPGVIVLIRTDAYKKWETPEYPNAHPGMSAEATAYLIKKGIRVMGIDAYGFDRPFAAMAKDYKAGDKGALWPSHVLGRKMPYTHIEKLAYLDRLPRPFGFKVAAFPVKIARASAGWVRCVAIFER